MEKRRHVSRAHRHNGTTIGARRSRSWRRLGLALLGLSFLARWFAPRLLTAGAGASEQPSLPRSLAASRPPPAPLPIAGRLLLAARLAAVPGLLVRASGPTRVVRSLRQELETIVQHLDRSPRRLPGLLGQRLACLTSLFKHAGIMGWNDLGRAAVIEGWIGAHAPVLGSDKMLTIDVQIVRLWVDSIELTRWIDDERPRYIRIEVFGGVCSQLEHMPKLGDCLRVRGPLRIDHDRDDFYEIHPPSAEDIEIVSAEEIGFERAAGGEQRREA